MPHVTFVPMTGFRVREPQMLELGMSLPGLQARASAIAELPALGVLTLAGMTPESWTCSYRSVSEVTDTALGKILADRPDVVAISALTASIEEAYRLCEQLRVHQIPVVMSGLHVSTCPEEAERYCDAVIVGRGESVWPQVLQDTFNRTLRQRYVVPLNTMPVWPMPRFDLLPHPPARFTLQTQAGCPLACGFCGASRLLSRFAEKPVEQIRDELNVIRQIAILVPTASPWLPIVIPQRSRLHRTTWIMAFLIMLVWPFVLPLTQPEQQRRRTAEQMLVARDFHGAIQFLSKHNRNAFPTHWSPPPYVTLANPVPPINDVMEVLLDETPANWVREIFLEKFRNTTERTLTHYGFVSDEELSSTLRILDRLPPAEWLSKG